VNSTIHFAGHIEFAAHFQPRPNLSHVLFDFDGTLSLIRQGWPEVMIPMFMEYLPRQAGDTEESVRQLVTDDIMRLNGKQTIYQMMQLAGRIKERGGIQARVDDLANGATRPDDLVVFEARRLLELLHGRGCHLYLASGTDEVFVKHEAAMLDLTRYFGRHIYGAQDDYKSFSKKLVIDRILAENQITGENLLAFGDGYVEIENTKQVGGLAVAVASDEAHNGSGNVDEWKRQRLLGVGADVVIPDYRDAAALLAVLTGEAPQPM
jgi:phosphoglycolate phosphatase